jgi:putative DNA primase/helicase
MSTIMNMSEADGEGCGAPKHNDLSRRVWEIEEVEPWPEPVDGRLLLNELEEIVRRHVVLPKWAGETVALWILHTYGFELRDVSTYLGVESPEKRCGKTTLLSVLSELSNRAVALANISSPAVYRSIEEKRPTLLIDEADTFLHGNDQLRGILNSGYTRKTAFVIRVGRQTKNEGPLSSALSSGGEREKPKAKGSRLERFSCWCPKVMAAIGHLPETLADRCIVIRMQRKRPGQECEKLRNLDGSALRRKCARFVLDNSNTIGSARPAMPSDLNDRAADVWEPLFALAEIAGGEWPEKARMASLGLTGLAQESSPVPALLREISNCFAASKTDRLFSRTLLDWLSQCRNAPWAEQTGGKPITEVWLSQQLRPYGIRPRTVWLMGLSAKGYLLEEFRGLELVDGSPAQGAVVPSYLER